MNGNVTAEFVFVNYGTPEDYELLLSNRIDLKGKIFIIKNYLEVRNITIGEKIALAEHYGAVGALTFFDLDTLGNEETKSSDMNVAISRDCNSEEAKIPVIPISKKLLLPVLDTHLNNAYESTFENGNTHHITNPNSNWRLIACLKRVN